MRIELHIDRVVLDGVGDPRHAGLIEEALRAELTRLVAESPRTTWQQSRRERRVNAPTVALGSPTALGRDVAASIHSGLARAGSSEGRS
jgi:hypothetical protein